MIYISAGSNLGNRLNNIQQAIERLKHITHAALQVSIAIETEALLPADVPESWNRPYLNAVIALETSLSPVEVLNHLKKIEKTLGRPEKYERWSPRVIDLDILLDESGDFNNPHLTIPHPELFNRPFLLHLITLINPLAKYEDQPISSLISKNKPSFGRSFALFPKLVGVVNITPDSFSDGNLYFSPEKAVEKAKILLEQGASIIELGAQSTRPGAHLLTATEECARLIPVFEAIKDLSLHLSLDSFRSEVIREILNHYPCALINDVTGALDRKTLEFTLEKKCKILKMHSLSIPPDKTAYLSESKNPMDEIMAWAEKTIFELQDTGFDKNDIILDPGIGFGKSPYQNLFIIRSLYRLKIFGVQVMAGHSRKSYIETFFPSSPAMRDPETAAISCMLSQQNIDYLRVHDVTLHHRLLVAQQGIESKRL